MLTISRVLEWFDQICRIPHTSGHEEELRSFIQKWAQGQGLKTRTDAAGNLLVIKPGRGCGAQSASVALQAHLDMVAEKNLGVPHNFLQDPIRTVRDGDWLRADQTTLGADNGAGVALMLTVLEDQEIEHPPLECLFTIDEETGLTGALQMDPELLSSRVLINLDSEETGVITIGCAGGVTGVLSRTLPSERVPPDYIVKRIWVRGLKGGHSGTDIHKRLGNSLVLLSRLWDAVSSGGDWRLQSFRGGDKHNAIPREAYLDAWAPAPAWEQVETHLANWQRTFAQELGDNGNSLEIKVTPASPELALGRNNSRLLGDFLLCLPHGVWTMSAQWSNLVETSSNLASVHTGWIDEEMQLRVLFSVRSDRRSLLEALLSRYASLGRLAGMKLDVRDGYPGWTPNPDSLLLQKACRVWQKLTGSEARVETVHAGLECGVLADKCPSLDMISIGPDIRGAHTPEERLHVPSLQLIGEYLVKLLRELC